MDLNRKIWLIDLISSLLFLVLVTGSILIIMQDNFQFFFNPRLLLFVGILSVISVFLMRKRHKLFAKTL